MRPFTILIAVLAVVFSFGIVGPASAAQGGNGNANNGKSDDAASSAAADTSNGQSEAAHDNGNSAAAKSDGGSSDTAKRNSGKSDTSKGNSGSTEPKGNDDRHADLPEQPVSNADENSGGANGQCSDAEPDEGYFCGTVRDQESFNGQGKGKATGKPDQAHVGKADNKNPPGQSENDNNQGYECDGNQGIAKGNPAHTSCGENVPPTTTEDKCDPKPDEDENCVKQGDECDPKPDEDENCVKQDDKCEPKDGEVLVNGECVKIAGEEECLPKDDEVMVGDECVPACPKDETIPMDDEDCKAGPPTDKPGNNRPPTVAGVEDFAGPPPAAVEQFAGPAPAGAPTGILPMTGTDELMNALGAAGMGLLVLGGATLLLRRRTTQS